MVLAAKEIRSMLRRLLSTNTLPLTLAVQGLAFVLLAFFAQPGTAPVGADGSEGGTGDATAEAAAAESFRVPRDLEPRRLPVPKLPDFERPLRGEAPEPKREAPHESPAPEVDEPALAGLRVQSVALAALVPVGAAAPLPGAPDILVPHSIDGRSWLAGTKSARQGPGGARGPAGVGAGNGGWGGTGIGGSGRGSGGHCPKSGGVGGSRGRPGGTGETTAGPSGVSARGGGGGSGSKGPPAGNGGERPAGGGKGPAKGKSKGE
jgi:hypothetical protein